MNQARWIEQCRLMRSHCRNGAAPQGYWGHESQRMLDRILANPQAPPCSGRLSLLQTFGAGPLQPDAFLLQGTAGGRLGHGLERLLRRFIGYGPMADAVLGPLGRGEATRDALLHARAAYANAVAAGAQLLGPWIRQYDIRSPEALGEQRVPVDGRPLSWTTLNALRNVLLIRQTVPMVGTLLEIGAGTGEFARLMLATGTAARCVIVDIPPALALSQEVLAEQVGAPAVEWFDPRRAALDPQGAWRCAFLTPDQLERVEQADLGVNIASFQEMPQAAVARYIAWCKRIGMARFASINTQQAHPVNAAEGVDGAFYERAFGSEYVAAGRYAWSKALDVRLEPVETAAAGYQLVVFWRRTV